MKAKVLTDAHGRVWILNAKNQFVPKPRAEPQPKPTTKEKKP